MRHRFVVIFSLVGFLCAPPLLRAQKQSDSVIVEALSCVGHSTMPATDYDPDVEDSARVVKSFNTKENVIVADFANKHVGDSVMQISPACKRPLSPSLQIGIPVGLAALGAWGALDNGWYHQQRESIRTQFLQWRKDKFIHVDDYIQYLATPAFLTLGFVPGIQARHNFRDRLLLGATSYALMGAMVNVTKYTVKSLRPDASARNSFPSGHTATAVMGAELVRSEYGNWAGLGAYAVAATVGVLRMYNNRHWINDVLGGAACGFASVRLGLLLLPLEKKLFGWDRQKALEKKTDKGTYSSLLVLPNFDVSQSTVGFAALWTF